MYKKNVWDQTKNPGLVTGDKETNIQFKPDTIADTIGNQIPVAILQLYNVV